MEFHKEFEENNTVVLGISRDSLKSHQKFRDKYNLPFLLLSDETNEIHDLFDVRKKKSMFGKEYMGVVRSTFLFDPEGALIKEFRNVKATGHAKDVMDYIKSIQEA